MNPLRNWSVDRGAIRTVGRDLQRPECILAQRDGTLWASDARGGVMRIAPDGEQELVLPPADTSARREADAPGRPRSLPNGLAFAAGGEILIANFGSSALEIMTRDGRTRTLLDRVDGNPIGKVNFVLRDSRGRLWISVSTLAVPWTNAICSTLADGYVVLLDEKGPRIVADGFAFTNEVRLDAREEYLYVAETTGKRVCRLRVRPDGSLGSRERHGPGNLGAGLLDGIAFDALGNLWCAMILADRLVAITPEGEALTLLEDGEPLATARFEAEFASGKPVSTATMAACGGQIAPWISSVTFGGPGLRTVYLGSLKGTAIPCFTSPVAGSPLVHW